MSEVVIFCGALMGAGLGFLWFNAQPAEVFMGDVGSLSLGGVIGFLAILAKQELILILAGGLFFIETLIRFWIISVLFALMSLSVLKIR